MKTLILHLKRFSIYSLMFASIGFVACEDENRQDMTPEIGEGEATPKITMYTPTAGGKSTSLTLYGTHFGTDLDNIRVTVNGVDAEVTGALGNIITANVQRGSGSGPVKVYIGQGEAASLGAIKRKQQCLVGFALETNNEQQNAEGKLERKNFDFIVLNSLNDAGAGFRHDTNKISIIDRKGRTDYPLKSKTEVAQDIIDCLVATLSPNF